MSSTLGLAGTEAGAEQRDRVREIKGTARDKDKESKHTDRGSRVVRECIAGGREAQELGELRVEER